jgi:fructose-1,6-bisphosphatase/inositol monophosphatase family enzyme
MFESGAIRLLVEQAGGIVQSVSGSPLKLFVTNQNVVISNRFLCSLLKDLMNKQLKQANKQ